MAVIVCHMNCQIYRPRDWTSEIAGVIGRRSEVPVFKRAETIEGGIKSVTRKIKLTEHIPAGEIGTGDKPVNNEEAARWMATE